MWSYDEKFWFDGGGWRGLKRSIVRVGVESLSKAREQDDFNDLKPSVLAERILFEMLSGIELRRDIVDRADSAAGRKRQMNRWSYALVLFASPENLLKAIERDSTLIKSMRGDGISAEKALGAILNRFLEPARRDISPGSAERQKKWEAIQRTSNEVLRQSPSEHATKRCSDEHFSDVARAMAEKYQGKNLRPTVETIRIYFYEFCSDCRDEYSIDDDETEGWISGLVEEIGEVSPLLCYDWLEKTDRSGWEAILVQTKIDEPDFPKVTMAQYLRDNNLTRTEFDKRLTQGLKLFQDCFAKMTDFNYRRTS